MPHRRHVGSRRLCPYCPGAVPSPPRPPLPRPRRRLIAARPAWRSALLLLLGVAWLVLTLWSAWSAIAANTDATVVISTVVQALPATDRRLPAGRRGRRAGAVQLVATGRLRLPALGRPAVRSGVDRRRRRPGDRCRGRWCGAVRVRHHPRDRGARGHHRRRRACSAGPPPRCPPRRSRPGSPRPSACSRPPR